jgi:hypothetical protein
MTLEENPGGTGRRARLRLYGVWRLDRFAFERICRQESAEQGGTMDLITLIPAVLYDVLSGFFIWAVTNPVMVTVILVLLWVRRQIRTIRRQGDAAAVELAEIKALLDRIATSYASELQAGQAPPAPVTENAA